MVSSGSPSRTLLEIAGGREVLDRVHFRVVDLLAGSALSRNGGNRLSENRGSLGCRKGPRVSYFRSRLCQWFWVKCRQAMSYSETAALLFEFASEADP